MALIDKKTLEHIAKLARIDITGMDEEKLVHDLEAILSHFEELKKVNTDAVTPLAGGTSEVNVMRKDAEPQEKDAYGGLRGKQDKLIQAFRDKKDDFLKVPPIFTE